MKLTRNLIATTILLLNISLSAQWTNIPNPGVLTTLVLPVGNNKIIYAGSHQNSPSGGGYVIAHRSDDFGTYARVYYLTGGTGTRPTMVEAASYNDSSICFHHNVLGYGVGYTRDGFKSTGLTAIGGYGCYSMINTAKNLFTLSPMPSYTTDTLMFKRTDIVASKDTVIYMPKYFSSHYTYVPKIRFINDSTGFILARYKSNTSKSVLLKTVDYGDNWTELLIDSLNPIGAYSFPSPEVGYVFKTNRNILKTIDGGASWYSLTNSVIASPLSIAFSNDSTGYIGGTNGALAKTINGGLSWVMENSGTTANIKSIYCFGPAAYIVTSTNTVYKNMSKGVSINAIEPAVNRLSIYPNPSAGMVTLEADIQKQTTLSITVKNMLGQNVYSISDVYMNTHITKNLDLGFLESGVYFVCIGNGQQSFTHKLILSK